ncbi:MAG TPA: pyrroloquinoline quinone-dependent dehydrogenase [Gemmatimonadaceae bacterium]|nr:pyrroloquinoline quinone-dependent dehydrogenase [Gemmatimonadaceae bacterium]
MHTSASSGRGRRTHYLVGVLAITTVLMASVHYTADWQPDTVVPGREIVGDPAALLPRTATGSGSGAVDWSVNGGTDGDHYSTLDEITRANVDSLQVAWVYRTGDVSDGEANPAGPATAFEATGLLIERTLYIATPSSRVIALDPERGTERWSYDAQLDRASFAGREVTARGVAAWMDPAHPADLRCSARIFLATFDARLIALDAHGGTPCSDFGDSGTVNLRDGVRGIESAPRDYAISSPPCVVGDVVIVGSSVTDNMRVEEPGGVVRAFDVRTGVLLWSWEPLVAYRGATGVRFAASTDFRSGAANAWSLFTADTANDLVFVPTGSASPDHFGGLRPGDDRDASSIVALRASTGEEVWAFQVVHHDLWDYDAAAQPALATVTREGAEIPVVIQATKSGQLFVLDRFTGEPVFPVEERAVPASDVPGEITSPTQPFAVTPGPLVPQGLRPEDAWGITPADRWACERRIRALRSDGVFTPPSIRGSVVNPGFLGGANWGGVGVDTGRHIAVVNTIRVAMVATLIPTPLSSTIGLEEDAMTAPALGAPYGSRRELLASPIGLPCSPPPWGTLVAVDVDAGGIIWQVPLGTMSDFAHLPAPARWGSPSLGGPLVTSTGLVFIAASMDRYLRAFDIETGRELWKAALPASAQASPMTYRVRPGGRQYIVIAAGGHHAMHTRLGDYLIAFTLP